ncbi:prepilin-type N-terminal cleavage/methylation domain-containing protein [Vibrio cyclitrophicus]|uniref:prepilin-type N-terminal cleavage/methylation domain-containing protein n=1 Tax=Vibrio cyclitrophicus TaxID=47951 RepID=UPI000C8388F3|nr:prepilin-type N-terminal cleavage/methylation domain-containing protein [Vibrio cyclitrophicus]MCC4775585.1 prepilin-type N-terminal cleavage/methylation domain-containing protein [Vibrio cyclitrophicus]MCC4842608.1 prepilin-type N-terminal cleavage/methylation domain-containing protein [Vibrio cyclitrophicus]PME15579.1 MSHA biogenesis protein MshB [Vibrio cyclitrophicus]PME45040.1 MSHA biogenesis protein MshB [Vibrio cyclitrophicus]PME83381.1 MSHA biogenesis protein MshB [Vibrio cyclitroph
MLKNQKGFSLVELVIVIVVVGLLAVAALPRFLDVTDEAKKSSIEGVAGGFATAVLSARAQWEAEARPSEKIGVETYNTVNYDGVDFWLTRSKNSKSEDTDFRDGYPWTVNSDSSVAPGDISSETCAELMQNLLQNPPNVAAVDDVDDDSNYKYSAEANSGEAKCTYIQLEGNTEHQFVYEIKTGRVTVTLQ